MIKDIDFTAAGYPSLDRIIKVEGQPSVGKTSIINNDDNSKIYYGGCNVNISCIGSQLGLNCAPVMKVGNDFESTGLKNFLQDNGVDCSGIEVVHKDVTSCTYLVMNEKGDHITLFYPGAMDTKYESIIDENIIKRSKYGIITVGNPEYNIEFANLCVKNNVPIIFGMKCDFKSFSPDILEVIIMGSEILFMNEGEKKEIERILKLKDITKLLDGKCTKCIVVTNGCKGSTIYNIKDGYINKEQISIAKPDNVIDSTGVGDAYIAGFMYAYLNGKPFIKCAQTGSVVSSYIIEKMGCLSNIPSIDEINKRYLINYEEEL